MALDADVLADLMTALFQDEMEVAFPEMVKSRTVVPETLDDGQVRYNVVEETGPIEIDPEQVRPMFKAIGRAIVEFLKGHAEVHDTAAGQRWRIL